MWHECEVPEHDADVRCQRWNRLTRTFLAPPGDDPKLTSAVTSKAVLQASWLLEMLSLHGDACSRREVGQM